MPATQDSYLHLEIAHILFLDVVGYSRLLVNEQREVLQQLNEVVRGAPQFRKSSAAGKLIRIATGDGMALVFFQSPEEPVHCAMEIAKALKNHPNIRLRMGVHSGPVDQISDVNDQTNVAGVGINYAQRVMDCGDAGHILISKRVADDLAQDSLWQPLLHEIGEIEMKHEVKLGIVNLYTEELGNSQTPRKLSDLRPQTRLIPSERALDIPEKSIAVLPFENLSADPENVFFADGVQDEILRNLPRLPNSRVTIAVRVMHIRPLRANCLAFSGALGVVQVLQGKLGTPASEYICWIRLWHMIQRSISPTVNSRAPTSTFTFLELITLRPVSRRRGERWRKLYRSRLNAAKRILPPRGFHIIASSITKPLAPNL